MKTFDSGLDERFLIEDFEPAYKRTWTEGLLQERVDAARRELADCRACPRDCGVDRMNDERAICHTGRHAQVASAFAHFGEEDCLRGRRGSGTIFFSYCNLKCVFCQNWDISQNPDGGLEIAPKIVARMLKDRSAHARNANWVGGDPTSNLAFILEVLSYSEANLAQVWNSNMYLTEDAMKLLDGVIDVYLTDFKYGNNKCGKRLSNVEDYWGIVTRNHNIANEQTEVIIRHLVLPNHIECCTEPIMKWIAKNLDTSKVRVNVMDQYHPEWHAFDHDDINRRLKLTEYTRAVGIAAKLKLNLCD
ncbi:radical SAM protein [Candidatus Pacearchaeota archaeon]|nr:radical SAM protein [Candidatus Pacearchaeota archaeon]